MLDELQLDGIFYGFSADLKIYLCLIGKQTASCLHSCPYCEAKAPWEEPGLLLTLGSLLEWHQKYIENGSVLKNAK